ncbi:MAG TPA: hypothetical protein VFN91_06020 [Myxococcaceae bacterium]|nr:hypothetical protein [Myxococcaceae bacterium]
MTRAGTGLVIVGVALLITAVISETALIIQLVAYEPACEPLATWSFAGACGGLRLIILLMVPFLLAGVALLIAGVIRRTARGAAA